MANTTTTSTQERHAGLYNNMIEAAALVGNTHTSLGVFARMVTFVASARLVVVALVACLGVTRA